MTRRVDWNTNEVLPRERPQIDVDEARRRLTQLDLKLGEGEGARSERARLQAVLDGGTPTTKKTRRGKRSKS